MRTRTVRGFEATTRRTYTLTRGGRDWQVPLQTCGHTHVSEAVAKRCMARLAELTGEECTLRRVVSTGASFR